MDSLRSWINDPTLANSAWWDWPIWLSLFAKLTFALSIAWLLHARLWQVNPRWRRLLWRTTALGCVVIALSLTFPPLLSWSVLPGQPQAVGQTQAISSTPEVAPAPPAETLSAQTNDATRSRSSGFDFSPQSPFAHGQRDSATPHREPRDAARGDAARNSHITSSHAIAPAKRSPSESPARVSSAAPAPAFRLGRLLITTWLCGVLLFALHTLFGILRLSRIRRRATLAPADVLARASEIGAQLGCRNAPQVLVSDEVAGPCIIGVLRPAILLPSAHLASQLAHELPAILAHELAHLRGHDVAWQFVIHTVATLGWFHPLLWRTRAAHALACDAVSDCVAAHYLGDAASYGRTLARLALRTIPAAATGMAMAQRSTVRLRIEMLRRRLFPASLRRGPVVLAVSVSLAACLLIGGLALAQAEPESKTPVTAPSKPAAESAKPKPSQTQSQSAGTTTPPSAPLSAAEPTVVPTATQPKSIAITVVDAARQPVAKARIRFVGRVNGKRFDRYVRSDAEGHATFEVPKSGEFTNFWMQCEKPGLVAIHYTWNADNQEIKLPAELNLRMEQGASVEGMVNDEAGQPIKGAKIEVRMPITWPRLANYVYTVVKTTTDEQGRWKSTELPAKLTDVTVSVSHPDYIQGFGKFSGRDNMAVLTQGLTVAGRVTDAAGKPIAKARARAGFSRFGTKEPETTTDADGRFVLKNCKSGKSIVTVQADGFAPQFKDLVIGPKNDDMNFQLAPGHTVRVRLLDPRGNPVPGVYFCTDTWRGYRTLDLRIQTDAEGRAQWPSAPDDTVLCDFFKTGHMSTRQVPIKAGADEIIVKIPDELVISGTVTDAETGKPIPEFGVRSGLVFANSDRVYLSNDEPTKFQNGNYTFKFGEPQRELLLEFSAKGYKPLESKHFLPTDGKQTFDAKLTPAQGSTGVVLLPNGKPAEGAEIALTTADIKGFLSSGYFRRGTNQAPVVKSDARGAFSILPRDEKTYKLYIVHDAGYAEILKDDFLTGKEIRLEPWGRVDGRVMLGDKPDANREITFWPMPAGGESHYPWIYFDFKTQSDQDGRFVFERIIPSKGQVARVVITTYASSSTHTPGWQVPVDVKPGSTVTANIGGAGRPIVGQIKLDRQPDVAIDWTTNEPATINLQEEGVKERTYFRAAGNIDRDGKFSIPDVPAGKYKLAFNVNNPPTPNACGAGEAIGRVTFDFEVPPIKDGRSDEPLDLGTITATLFDTLDPGEVAPGFVLAGLNGDSVRLSDFHGKLVLLDFWATWCQPCLAEMPALAELQKEFGDNPRFAIVGLSCDQQIEPPRNYVQQKGFDWIQAHAGAVGAGNGSVAGKYTVRALPATYLIGPDGRVLAKNLRGKELKAAISAALADEALFKAAASSAPPPRFPVVRFQNASTAANTAARPAILVMDDCDPGWEKELPHHDALTAYAEDGAKLWTVDDLHTCQQVNCSGALAIDRTRQRIYAVEQLSKRMLAVDFGGRKQWQAEQVDASALAVDAATGNLWITGGPSLNQGETIVLDPQGNEIAAYPFVGIDIAADEQRGVFWLAGYEILQCDRSGQVRVRLPVSKTGGWCCGTVAVDPTDGSAWFGERAHPDIAESRNRLWHVGASGQILRQLDLGKSCPAKIARDPNTGDLWIVSYPREIRRLAADGTFKDPLAIEANNVAISSATRAIWAATDKELLKLDAEGKVLLQQAFAKPSQQVFLVAD